MKLREKCGVYIYDRGPRSIPFVVDEVLKFPFQIPPDSVDLARKFANGGVAEPDESAEGLASGFRQQGLLEDGRSADEVRNAIRATWKRDHEHALAEAVSIAADRLPMFKNRIAPSARSFGNRFDWEMWHRIPILSRGELRAAFPHGYVADADERSQLVQSGEFGVVESSGTSGDERLRVLADIKRSDGALIASRFINRHLFPETSLRQAVFTTLHCSGLVCLRERPQMEMRVLNDNILTLLPPEDVTAPTVQEIKRTIREISAHEANWLRVNPTYLSLMTYKAMDEGIELPRLRLMTTGYEYPSRIHRALLSKAWNCPVYSSYGVTELQGFGMVECEQGHLHVNDRYFHFELYRDGHAAKPGELGRVVATTLRGRLPIIRYDLGDAFIKASPDFQCPCGSVYSHLGRFAGRSRDTIRVQDGRILCTAEIDDVVSKLPGIRFYQFQKVEPNAYRMTVVLDPTMKVSTVRDAAHVALEPLIGRDAKLTVTPSNAIFPERSGKFRMTSSLIDPTPALVATRAEAATGEIEFAPQ